MYETFGPKEVEYDSDDSKKWKKDDEDVEDPQSGTSSDSSRKKRQFSASNVRFVKFRKLYDLQRVSLHGEASWVGTFVAEPYVNETFKNIISEGEYQLDQGFYMDQTGLFWKRMPS